MKVEYLYIVIIFRLFVKIKNDSLTRKISKTFTQTLEQFEVGVSIFQNYPPPLSPHKKLDIKRIFKWGRGGGNYFRENTHPWFEAVNNKLPTLNRLSYDMSPIHKTGLNRLSTSSLSLLELRHFIL